MNIESVGCSMNIFCEYYHDTVRIHVAGNSLNIVGKYLWFLLLNTSWTTNEAALTLVEGYYRIMLSMFGVSVHSCWDPRTLNC